MLNFEYSSNERRGTQRNNFFHDDYFRLHLWIFVITTMLCNKKIKFLNTLSEEQLHVPKY